MSFHITHNILQPITLTTNYHMNMAGHNARLNGGAGTRRITTDLYVVDNASSFQAERFYIHYE